MPAGIALHARLTEALLENARRDLALAPRVLTDRTGAMGDALMMHAKELAHDPALTDAMARGDKRRMRQALAPQYEAIPNGMPVVVGPDALTWSGPTPSTALIDATRAGKMPVAMATDSTGVRFFSLAPIERDGKWLGAAGFALGMDLDAARVLAGLTRSEVVIIDRKMARATAATLDSIPTGAIVAAVTRDAVMYSTPGEVRAGDERLLVSAASLGDAAAVAFVRVVGSELAIVPALSRIALTLATASFGAALLLGAWLTTQVTRPVRKLSEAARAFATGTTDVALPDSRLDDIAVVSRAFGDMRTALAARIAELRDANQSLSDHSTRLATLQNDLMRRERLDASTRLVGELAHEVRNPIASLRNLLELIRRRSVGDTQTTEYADLAIDELLRMHELAERMLDLNRPSTRASLPADALRIATDVARLASLGAGRGRVVVEGDDAIVADIGGDALRQVLVNLVRNAREALDGDPPVGSTVNIRVRRMGDRARITVSDNGPGIASAVLPRIFDPFVTTKQSVHGVGLGLYVAESTVRAAGGTISAHNEPSGGACFVIELPMTATPAEVAG
ncbi:MAG: HAMP domain-containing sensor histidine kinase [Gemmatimonadaceae bacterium]